MTFEECVLAGLCKQGCDRICARERSAQIVRMIVDTPSMSPDAKDER